MANSITVPFVGGCARGAVCYEWALAIMSSTQPLRCGYTAKYGLTSSAVGGIETKRPTSRKQGHTPLAHCRGLN